MLYEFYQHLPLSIDPVAFAVGSFGVRWYGLSYFAGFLVVYLVLLWRIKHQEVDNIYQISNFHPPAGGPIFNKFPNSKLENKKNQELFVVSSQLSVLQDFLLVAFFLALLGGRMGYVLFYNFSYFLTNPWSIVSPFDQQGHFIGLYGMSYHGALVGILVGSWGYLKMKKIDFLAWADWMVPAIPLGYFFGRVGNFLNGELYGRITASPLGMYFGADPLNLRHPSQLYEALLEGLLLFAILWQLRNSKFKKGSLLAAYLIDYGLVRIVAEQFREPDFQIGLLAEKFTLGQLLSFMTVVAGVVVVFLVNRKKCYTEDAIKNA